MLEREAQVTEFEERVVNVNRCAKVVKGGRRFSFAALVVVGNKNGKIGMGLGKAKEVAEAIRKAGEAAHRNLIEVHVQDGTIPHDITIKFCATNTLLLPAAPGTGVIAGAAARAVLELAGINNILTKVYGSTNPLTVVRACIKGLTSQRNQQEFAALRGNVGFAQNAPEKVADKVTEKVAEKVPEEAVEKVVENKEESKNESLATEETKEKSVESSTKSGEIE